MVWKICEDNEEFVIVTIVLNEGFVVVACQGNVGCAISWNQAKGFLDLWFISFSTSVLSFFFFSFFFCWLFFFFIIFDLFNYLKEKWNEKHTANEYMLKPGMKPILSLY